ncbi:hypothetical protein AHAS_Ahas16G0021100 [Arachis hypogaea]
MRHIKRMIFMECVMKMNFSLMYPNTHSVTSFCSPLSANFMNLKSMRDWQMALIFSTTPETFTPTFLQKLTSFLTSIRDLLRSVQTSIKDVVLLYNCVIIKHKIEEQERMFLREQTIVVAARHASKWAFKEGEEKWHSNLVVIGKEIVKKCKGVPLAIRTLGSLLYSKYEINDWESLRDAEIWNLPQKKDDILPALKLSYDQMPSYLRQCFAMFSLFPKDCRLTSVDVVSLWSALGLLPTPSKNETSLDVGNRYLSELMSRYFLENISGCGTSYHFCIHDLVHDLALYVAKDERQLISSDCQNIPENVLHLSLSEFDLFGKSFKLNLLGVRTLLFPFGRVGANNEDLFRAWVSSCKYLRYLNLDYSTFETLPRSISQLKHLRYLSLSLQSMSITTKQSVLPECDIAKSCALMEIANTISSVYQYATITSNSYKIRPEAYKSL